MTANVDIRNKEIDKCAKRRKGDKQILSVAPTMDGKNSSIESIFEKVAIELMGIVRRKEIGLGNASFL